MPHDEGTTHGRGGCWYVWCVCVWLVYMCICVCVVCVVVWCQFIGVHTYTYIHMHMIHTYIHSSVYIHIYIHNNIHVHVSTCHASACSDGLGLWSCLLSQGWCLLACWMACVCFCVGVFQ